MENDLLRRPTFMAASDVAKMLGTCTETIYRYVKRGRIPVHRFGKKLLRFDRSEVLKALDLSE